MPRTSGGTGGGGGGAGGLIVRKFAFAYDTANLDTGAALYTPTVGDILLDAWIEIDTAWNGTTPLCDIGEFTSGAVSGYLYDTIGPIGPNQADADDGTNTILQGGRISLLSSADAVVNASVLLKVSGAGPNLYVSAPNNGGLRTAPAKFMTANPVCVVVSQDGTPTAQSTVLADSAPTLPLTIILATNDTFIFTPTAGGGTPETFTIAPGVYTTIAEAVAAMAAATGSAADTFGQYVTPSDSSGSILLTNIVDSGIAGNGDTITEGDGGAAALGFTANPDTFASGTGGDPGSTQGAAILYLVTATPT